MVQLSVCETSVRQNHIRSDKNMLDHWSEDCCENDLKDCGRDERSDAGTEGDCKGALGNNHKPDRADGIVQYGTKKKEEHQDDIVLYICLTIGHLSSETVTPAGS